MILSTDVRRALRMRERGFLLNPARFAGGGGGGGTDPYFANVALLLHMDGTNGSTTFTDHSPFAATMTVNNSATISTAQSKFGGAAGTFSSISQDSVQTPSSSNYGIGSGDYTIEGWRYNGALGLAQRCMFDSRAGGNGIAIYASANAPNCNDRLILADNSAIIAGTSTTQFTANTWQHWAVCRNGTTVRGFIDGVQVWSITDSRTLAATTSFRVGCSNFGSTDPYSGYLDDVRATIGVARYTSGFTAPSAAFPNS